jgi:hypothetical protein
MRKGEYFIVHWGEGVAVVESGNGLICIVMYNVAFGTVWV